LLHSFLALIMPQIINIKNTGDYKKASILLFSKVYEYQGRVYDNVHFYSYLTASKGLAKDERIM